MNNNSELRSLLDAAQALSALQQQFNDVSPPLFAQSTQVLGLHRGTLFVATKNGALAAKLRQLSPELVTKLQNKGCEVNGIRVKVQVSYATPAIKQDPRQLSRTAQQQLLELSEGLDDSPLKQALKKLSQKK